jgi:hypothetical protein
VTERPTESASGAWWPLVLLPLGLILYLASVGPVAWFVHTSGLPMDSTAGMIISTIYWPVEYLANEVPGVGELIIWYVEMFCP